MKMDTTTENKIENSYEKHREHWKKEEHIEKIEAWKRSDTVDAWRMNRLLTTINPILENFKGAKWLTVGDGCYGNDAHFIKKNGGLAHASDIGDHFLKMGLEEGRIDSCSAENAEALSFSDNSFDFVLCSHAYHHFPRPQVAFYEMLRVAKKGVAIIEPHDDMHFGTTISIPKAFGLLLRSMKNFLLKLAGKDGNYNIGRYIPTGQGSYETSGNFEYFLSEREVEKAAIGLDLPCVAFKWFNDHHEVGCEFELAEEGNAMFDKVRGIIESKEHLSNNGIFSHDQITAIILKEYPDAAFEKALKDEGYLVLRLSKNPYID